MNVRCQMTVMNVYLTQEVFCVQATMTCFRCGRKGHYADECYANTSTGNKKFCSKRNYSYYDEDECDLRCFRCGRAGHFADSCYAKTMVGGTSLYSEYSSESSSKSFSGYSCFRCGRAGHFADSCYAKTTLNGVPLQSGPSSGPSSKSSFLSSSARMNETPFKRSIETCFIQGGNKMACKREGVYVLQTSGSTLQYVGKSKDIDSRIQDHREGFGAICLSKGVLGMGTMYEVAPITSGSTDDMESWERNETLTRMRLFGIDKVRGWMFTSSKLSEDDKRTAFNQICEKFDLCRRCGRTSHFVDECFATTADSWADDMRLE